MLGAVICKVIVTDYVSDTSPDSGLPGVFRVTDGHREKKKYKKLNHRSFAKSCCAKKRKESERMKEQGTLEVIAVVVPHTCKHVPGRQIEKTQTNMTLHGAE